MQREPERTHTHRMRVRTQITWTWLCTRGKKLYKYCSFSHTNRSFRVLGHQCSSPLLSLVTSTSEISHRPVHTQHTYMTMG